ncbi:hypothetical protein NMY22_g18670 [Coprinellus aureogranulatus]|nr:hypothetical protein NMY22_g18670 [Coprinellus aureogranulatus]
MHSHICICLATLALFPVALGTLYRAVKEYSTTNLDFFTGWDFYGHGDDIANGNVYFVSSELDHRGPPLTYIVVHEKSPSVDDRAILKVDNVTVVPDGGKRRSVRITTRDSFDIGSLWQADIHHSPYGCSVSPSFFSFSKDAGPKDGGQINIFGGANLDTRAWMGIRTAPDAQCRQESPAQESILVNSTECSTGTGCMVTSSDRNSYGEAFAQQKGGVFITEFAESGISIWFKPRGGSNASTIDTAMLGRPMAHWPSSGCDIKKAFGPQSLGFEITLCGGGCPTTAPSNTPHRSYASGRAGNPGVFSQTCPGQCYADWVVGDPGSKYNNAYFEIGYVKVFAAFPPSNSSVSSPTSTTTSDQPGATNASQGLKADLVAATMLAAFGAVLLAW